MLGKVIFSYKGTSYPNNYSLLDLDRLLQPRVYSFDIKEIFLKLKSKYYDRNIMGTKYSLSAEKSAEFTEKRQEIVSLLINTPLVHFNFHNFISSCGLKSISIELPSHYVVQKSLKKCNLHFYCPFCNAFLITSVYPYIKTICHKNAGRKYYYKTFLVWYKNVELNFQACLWNIFYIHFENLSTRFNIKEYIFSMKPSFNVNENKSTSMFDVMFLCLEVYDISESSAEEIYDYSKEVFKEWSKSIGTELQFDFDVYEIDFFTKDMFDIVSVLLYRIPIEVYFSLGVNLSYYQYLYSSFFTNSSIFKKYIYLHSRKPFIYRLFDEFRTDRDYRFLNLSK